MEFNINEAILNFGIMCGIASFFLCLVLTREILKIKKELKSKQSPNN